MSRTPPKAGERARSENSALKDIKAGEMRENVAIFKGIYSFLNTVPAKEICKRKRRVNVSTSVINFEILS